MNDHEPPKPPLDPDEQAIADICDEHAERALAPYKSILPEEDLDLARDFIAIALEAHPQYRPLAERIARATARRRRAPLDELLSSANLALVEAARRYGPTRGVPFDAYASHRIIGELLNHFRAAGHQTTLLRRLLDARLRAHLRAAFSIQAICEAPPPSSEPFMYA